MTETLQRKPKILNDLCIFILSHGNPDGVLTANSLHKYGYTGDWYILLDDEDKSYQAYVAKFGEKRVITFNKSEVARIFDRMDNDSAMNTVVFARNACFAKAKELGYKYFMEYDEDYYEFQFRFEEDGHLRALFPTNLDVVFEALLEYYISIPSMKTLCIAQNGDFLGGIDGSHFKARFMRKAMNTFLCSVDRPFTFIGYLNEDVNTYCVYGARGDLFATIMDVSINQTDTQQKDRDSGLTGAYTGDGTYRKSFYTVMCCPSFTKIGIIGNNHARIHHNVDWKYAVPKIISDKYRVEE